MGSLTMLLGGSALQGCLLGAYPLTVLILSLDTTSLETFRSGTAALLGGFFFGCCRCLKQTLKRGEVRAAPG